MSLRSRSPIYATPRCLRGRNRVLSRSPVIQSLVDHHTLARLRLQCSCIDSFAPKDIKILLLFCFPPLEILFRFHALCCLRYHPWKSHIVRGSPPENGHFSSSLKLGPSKRINAYGSNDESLKVWLDYSNFFLPYDVLVVGWKFGGHGWLSHVL